MFTLALYTTVKSWVQKVCITGSHLLDTEESPAISDGITDLVGTMVHEVSATQEDHPVRYLRHVDSKRQHHTGHICGRQRWGLDSGRLGCE